jgi:hypothetical protein
VFCGMDLFLMYFLGFLLRSSFLHCIN